ncbi:hypothetical protein OROHE_002778 [Orobanche hederae]
MTGARRDGPLMRIGGRESLRYSRIAAAAAIGILTGLIFAFLYPYGFFISDPVVARRRLSKSTLQASSAECESSEKISMLKSDMVALSEKNAKLKKEIRELNEKLKLAEQGEDTAQKRIILKFKGNGRWSHERRLLLGVFKQNSTLEVERVITHYISWSPTTLV